ncbi:cytochrome c553 [Altererythrobacter atlanticus]|uniref:Uncharacterized protein n=1 Tax=Croceibacterium atlanticum TaxID=1267766 RepID=A0A0F7KRD1_9SPHN|nr:hypothetical protein [Croceibacterium atlanticum]AKH42149.1 hypothetical protein WYH_01102 [Croceibacterium atlanticum]MBB5734038.1 cytochrome c553 [Croceibacterium atlanticum]
MTIDWKSLLLGALAMLVLLILIALLVILTGGYNVAATERHSPITAWRSTPRSATRCRGRGNDIAAPELTPAMVAAGAGEYKTMCAHCHDGVGERAIGGPHE